MTEVIDDKNLMVMKLLHYFITEKNYNPIILQGVENEIWLENMDSEYKIVRIVSNHIHNAEQFEFDLFKTKHVVKKIKRKTLSLNMNVLSIFLDVRDSSYIDSVKNYTCICIEDEDSIGKYDEVTSKFPDITKKLKFSEEGLQLFMKITGDINKKNQKEQVEAEDIFKPKKPVITNALIAINIFIYALMFITNSGGEFVDMFAQYGPYIFEDGEFYRLITSAFIHGSIFHLAFNCYALYVIGSQVESFMGKTKYLIIYIASAIGGCLLSAVLCKSASIGASGAVFGLMGALLYFGYHYRVYLGNVINSQILPLIFVNLLIGFIFSNYIDNYGHIGGLISGILISMAVGVKYKSTNSERINGIILFTLFVAFLIFMGYRFI